MEPKVFESREDAAPESVEGSGAPGVEGPTTPQTEVPKTPQEHGAVGLPEKDPTTRQPMEGPGVPRGRGPVASEEDDTTCPNGMSRPPQLTEGAQVPPVEGVVAPQMEGCSVFPEERVQLSQVEDSKARQERDPSGLKVDKCATSQADGPTAPQDGAAMTLQPVEDAAAPQMERPTDSRENAPAASRVGAPPAAAADDPRAPQVGGPAASRVEKEPQGAPRHVDCMLADGSAKLPDQDAIVHFGSDDDPLDDAEALAANGAERAASRRAGGCCGCFMAARDAVGNAVHKVFPPGGVMSSGLTLASGAIGAGILGLPGAMNSCGLVLAMIYLVIFSTFTVFSMRMIAHASLKTGIRSFEGVLRVLFPGWHGAFAYWAAFIRWFFSLGCCVGYIISVQDTFLPIFSDAYDKHPNDALKYFKGTNGRRLLGFLVWLFIMVPLVIPKHIDSLRYASFVAIALMCYFCVIIIVHSAMHGLPKHRHNVTLSGRQGDDDGDTIFLFRTGNPALGELGTFMFAYVIQGNAVEVTWDLRPEIRSAGTMTKATALAMVITFIIYSLVSVFGYFDFGARELATHSMMLMYHPLEDPEVMVAYVGVLVKLCVAYALMHMAARNSIYYAFGWTERYREEHRHKKEVKADANPLTVADVTKRDPASDEGVCPVMVGDIVESDTIPNVPYECDSMVSVPNRRTFVDNIPWWQHLLVVICLSGLCLILGLFIPNINIVFGFAGSICGGFLGFIFPPLMFMYSGGFTPRRAGWVMFIMGFVLLVCGVVGIVFGTGSTIYGLAGGK